MERHYIDITLPNVITIVLINLVGATILGFGLKLYNQSKAGA